MNAAMPPKSAMAEDRIDVMAASAQEEKNIISNVQRYAALMGAVVIALGFLPVPITDPSLPKATWFEWLIAISPLLPLAIFAVTAIRHQTLPNVFARILAFVIFSIGAIATFFIAAFSGGGFEIVLLGGTALTLACVTSILLISTVGHRARSIALGVYGFSVLVGTWSLAMVPLAYSSAVEVSANRAFCIGEHSPIEKELGSIVGLRGLSFYTSRSGHKIGDTWYFHGLLLVEDDDVTRVYNWSPRNMEFQEVERPRLLIASPFKSCEPRQGFLREISIF